MYYLFKYHHIKPSEFYNMGRGEKQILQEFMHFEIDEKNEEAKSLTKGGF